MSFEAQVSFGVSSSLCQSECIALYGGGVTASTRFHCPPALHVVWGTPLPLPFGIQSALPQPGVVGRYRPIVTASLPFMSCETHHFLHPRAVKACCSIPGIEGSVMVSTGICRLRHTTCSTLRQSECIAPVGGGWTVSTGIHCLPDIHVYLVHSLTYFSTSPFDRKGFVFKMELFSNAFITVLPKKNTYCINTGVNNCYFVFIIA